MNVIKGKGRNIKVHLIDGRIVRGMQAFVLSGYSTRVQILSIVVSIIDPIENNIT